MFNVISVTPVLSLAAYTANDVAGALLTFAGAASVYANEGRIRRITVIDADKEKAAGKIYFFNADPSAAAKTDAAEFLPAAADLAKLIAVKAIAAADFVDSSSDSVAVYLLDGIFGIDASDPHAYLASMDEEDPTACQSFVLQYGQTGVGMRAAGLMMDKLSIVGDANGPVKFNTHLTGLAAIDDDPETIALAASPLVLGAHSQLFLDPIAGPLGTTELDITGYSFAWNAALPSRVPVWYLGSGIGPGAHRASRWGGNVNLNLEMTATEFTRYMTLVDAINGRSEEHTSELQSQF